MTALTGARPAQGVTVLSRNRRSHAHAISRDLHAVSADRGHVRRHLRLQALVVPWEQHPPLPPKHAGSADAKAAHHHHPKQGVQNVYNSDKSHPNEYAEPPLAPIW